MNENELTDVMIEIIIAQQPLAASSSLIRRKLYNFHNRYYPNNIKIIRLLRQRSERDSNLIEIKTGRDILWKYKSGSAIS